MTQLPSESERRRKVGMKCPLNLTCCYHLSTCLLTDHRELVFAGISSSRSRGWIDRQELRKTRKQPFFYPPQLVPRTQEHLITVEHLLNVKNVKLPDFVWLEKEDILMVLNRR